MIIRIITLIIMAVIMVIAMNNKSNNKKNYYCALGHCRPPSNRTFLMFESSKFTVPLESGASPTFILVILVSLSTF